MPPNKIILTRSQLHLIIITLAIAPFCANVVSVRATLKQLFDLHPDEQLFDLHPDEQLFVFSVKKEL